jgi:hypothetical protein
MTVCLPFLTLEVSVLLCVPLRLCPLPFLVVLCNNLVICLYVLFNCKRGDVLLVSTISPAPGSIRNLVDSVFLEQVDANLSANTIHCGVCTVQPAKMDTSYISCIPALYYRNNFRKRK